VSAVDVRIGGEGLDGAVVLSLDGHESMDALSDWALRITVPEALDDDALLRAPVTVTLVDPVEGCERPIRLLVTEVESELGRGRDRVYRLRLSDPLWVLRLRGGYRLFFEKTTEEIVTQVLTDAGIPAAALQPRLSGSYPVRLQCAQYDESEWDFVARLLAEEGISCWFDTSEQGEHRVYFGDGLGSHDGIEGGATLPYAGPLGALRPEARAFSSLAWEEQVVVDRVMLRDFDIRNPDVYIEGESGEGELEHFIYPGFVPSSEAATARAERRLEQLRREQVSVRGETDCIRVKAGRVLEVSGGGAEIFEQKMLISAVTHRYERPLRDGGRGVPYGNAVTMRPSKGSDGKEHAAFRPALRAAPSVEHLESAVISGPAGEEIHVDDLGRVKIRMPWDRAGIEDDRSSHWTRCLQYPLGASMFLPRVGWEVSVGYLDGSPDRPFVLGRLYNATAVVPYGLPAASATSAFQSWTTPRSGMTQEIKMVDDAGSQLFALHASKDLSIKVGGTQKTEVGGDEDHQVSLSLTSNVLGAHTASVAAMQSIDVGEELLVTVDGSNTEIIAAAEVINVTGNRAVLASGSCVEVVGGGYTLQCNQSNVHASGVSSRAVLGSKVIAAGLGVTESVAMARSYVCLGSRTITCGPYAESIIVAKRSKAGTVSESAAAIGLMASSATIKAGSATVTAGGKVSLIAPKVTVEVGGNIVAGPLTLGGSTLRINTTAVVGGATSRTRGGTLGS
jgi:type VI secretion system secreted protein VgrG